MSASGNGGSAPFAPGGLPSHAQEGNPLDQFPYFFHRLGWLVMGRRQDLETMRTPRVGIIRQWLAGKGDEVPAGPSFSWPRNTFDTNTTRAAATHAPIRYLISDNAGADPAGPQLSNPLARPVVPFQAHHGDPPLIRAGQQQGRPTVRSRLTSFGSRVPPINRAYSSEETASA